MSGTVLEIQDLINKDHLAISIVDRYLQWYSAHQIWVNEKKELRNFLFATDTTKTTNDQLPWKNKTTLPKLTQLRDNLHANYMSALFPNDDWLKWDAYTKEDSELAKREAIQAYMSTKTREGDFIETVSQLVYDWIDYGNVFGDSEYVAMSTIDAESGETISGFQGPRAVRISPIDIVFDPTAPRWEDTPKIRRVLKSVGELKAEAEDKPEFQYNLDVIDTIADIRSTLARYSATDIDKAMGYRVDGFGDLAEYYNSGYVELLEFEGDIHDERGNLIRNHIITVVDRTHVVRQIKNPNWLGKDTKVHDAWRKRPDNLYGMGPLDNLVGMQYRIDHLENIKADLYDLIAHPPLKIRGNVEEFEWGPFAEIFLGDDGDVDILKVDATALTADNQIAILMQQMEEFAGAPKQAMGIRTPGEKTMFEVQSLDNAAGRMFQHKVNQFERNVLEPLLNNMLELASRNLNTSDVVKVMDNDLGVERFLEITKEDITAKGKLRPIGARHFAARAQLVQNVQNIFNSSLMADEQFKAHFSMKSMAAMIEEVMGLERFDLVKDNVRVFEQGETAQLASGVQAEIQMNEMTPTGEEEPGVEEELGGEGIPPEMMEQLMGGQ